jgi:hypothetical protein
VAERYKDDLLVWAVPNGKPPQPIAWDMRSHTAEFAKAAEACHAEIVEGDVHARRRLARRAARRERRRRPYQAWVSIGKESPTRPQDRRRRVRDRRPDGAPPRARERQAPQEAHRQVRVRSEGGIRVPLTSDQAVEQAAILRKAHEAERDAARHSIRRYWKGRQAPPRGHPDDAPREVKDDGADRARERLPIVVDSLAQSIVRRRLPRRKDDADDSRSGRLAGEQDGRPPDGHPPRRAAYGAAYASCCPATPMPVIRGVSPRNDDGALRRGSRLADVGARALGRGLWRSTTTRPSTTSAGHAPVERRRSRRDARARSGVTPVVRYLDEDDLDADDEVEPETQAVSVGETTPDARPGRPADADAGPDRPDDLRPARRAALRRVPPALRIGWVPRARREDEGVASQLWTFDEAPDEMKLGEFEQTNLEGYIKSREASLRHAATLSQTPVHELIGELVNLSAEALAAAEAGKDRKVGERHTLLGESHEQTLWLVGADDGRSRSPTTRRSCGATPRRARSPRPSTRSASSRRCSASRPRSCGSASPAPPSRTSSGGTYSTAKPQDDRPWPALPLVA